MDLTILFSPVDESLYSDINSPSSFFKNIHIFGEKMPDYRVTTGHTDLGAAWKRTSEAQNVYLSVQLDDPALLAPVHCALVKTGASLGYTLIWERRRKTNAGSESQSQI